MKSTLEPYQYLKRFFSHDFVASLSEENFLYRFLVDQQPEEDVWRQHTNDCLELAYRYDLVDADLEARLKKGDLESWQASINELKVAKFMEELFGITCLRWHPQGRKKKVGEFELVSNILDNSLFVEVKTIFPRELEALEEHIMQKLSRYAEQVPIPAFLDVSIKEVGKSENFSGRRFKAFLIKEIGGIKVEDVRKESLKLSDYKDDATGLHLEVKVLPLSPDELRSCHIGVIHYGVRYIQNEAYIQHSLYKAYTQLPTGMQPCLVILCPSTAFPIDEHNMLNALLGTLGVRFYLRDGVPVTELQDFRASDGFFQPRRNRKLSAVAVYKEKLIETKIETNLEIYHNPFASNRLGETSFESKRYGVRQLVKVNDQNMEWIG